MIFLFGGRRRVAVGRRDVFVYDDPATGNILLGGILLLEKSLHRDRGHTYFTSPYSIFT
jgi:hypothetical protein